MSSIIEETVSNNVNCKETVLEVLDQEIISKHLDNLGINNISDVHVFENITSTNDFLLENEAVRNNVAVCVAEQQLKGRGRYGNQWQSPGGVNLYLSVAWPLQTPKQAHEQLCLWLLITLADLLKKNGCSGIQLKWPNDICAANKKLAGVLIERKVGIGHKHLVIGLGLNIAMSSKRNVNLVSPWTDVLTVNPNWSVSRNQLVAEVVSEFHKTLSRFDKNNLENLTSEWMRYDMLLNKQVSFLFKGIPTVGDVIGIDELGRIIVDISGKHHHLHSAHISEIRITEN